MTRTSRVSLALLPVLALCLLGARAPAAAAPAFQSAGRTPAQDFDLEIPIEISDPRVLSADIYDYFRNPLSHALGVQEDVAGRVEITRLGALTDQQILALDELAVRPTWLAPTLATSGNERKLLIEGFYRDVLEMMQRLARDSSQMSAAEARFVGGKVIWRAGTP